MRLSDPSWKAPSFKTARTTQHSLHTVYQKSGLWMGSCQIICSLGGVGRARVMCMGYVHCKSLYRALGALGQDKTKIINQSTHFINELPYTNFVTEVYVLDNGKTCINTKLLTHIGFGPGLGLLSSFIRVDGSSTTWISCMQLSLLAYPCLELDIRKTLSPPHLYCRRVRSSIDWPVCNCCFTILP